MTPALIRGLTLRHPWPTMFLLDDEPKRIENRDWAPPRRMLGQLIALHGGALPKPSDADYLQEIRDALEWVADIFDDPDPVDAFTDQDLLRDFCVSGIFGVARLQEVVTSSDDPWFTGDFGWVLTDFVPINPPIRDRSPSHRSLWEIEEVTREAVLKRWEARQGGAAPQQAPSHPAPLPLGAAPAPGLFCPGVPLQNIRQRLESGRLYGLAADGDWITVMRRKDGLHWRAMRAGDFGSGTRGDLEAYLGSRKAGAA